MRKRPNIKIIIEKHKDGYVAYPIGLKGVVVGQGDRQEAGSHGYGGREGFSHFLATQAWQAAADEAVREAQQAAVEAVGPGVTVGEVDHAARNLLKKRNLAEFFTHSTGHGVGLEIHEAPRVAAGQKEVLRPGMVITIEPGVYVPGKWGVRIEDMFLVTEHGHEVLTPTSKQFTAL